MALTCNAQTLPAHRSSKTKFGNNCTIPRAATFARPMLLYIYIYIYKLQEFNLAMPYPGETGCVC